MTIADRTGQLDERFSGPDASPSSWGEVKVRLEGAETYWLTTVREDGRPHSTPLVGVWHDDAFWFCTGSSEQKAHNLEHHRAALVAVGSSNFEGLDVVVEGQAQRITDEALLHRVADSFNRKYPPPFQFEVRDGGFYSPPTHAIVFEVRPAKVLAFRKDDPFGQTRFLPND
jgi:nitroimidazol reductase NimA-like FMN-containing flavoprotein (pyridoxamine 5'-phosphate oxidase superfamily)